MGDWTTIGETGRIEGIGAIQGTTLPNAPGIDTKSGWTEFIASSAHDANWIVISMTVKNNDKMLIDIGVGASSSEVVILPNIKVSGNANAFGSATDGVTYSFPVFIPAGTRVSVRFQTNSSSGLTGPTLNIYLIDTSLKTSRPLSTVIDYGTNLATSTGTTVDPGATINTWGSWAELVASTTYDIYAIHIGVCMAVLGASVLTNQWALDFAIGAGDQSLTGNVGFPLRTGAYFSCAQPTQIPLMPMFIPAGTKISARAQSISSTSRDLEVILYGVS